MAELDVGRHCAVGACGRLDFLPFVCNGCGKVFCLEHRGKDDHECTEPQATPSGVAPAGGAPVPSSSACGVPGCLARELLPVLCAHCGLQLCLRHRHQADHACPNLQAAAPRMQRTQQLVQSITEGRRVAGGGRRGARSAAVTARVRLMKTKQQAAGEPGVPQEERLYLRVRLPRAAGVSERRKRSGGEDEEEEEEERAVFVSRAWSVGRVVDWIAGATRLPNNNHVASAAKLRLCDAATRRAWPMDVRVDSLLSAPGSEGDEAAAERLTDGASVVLEYLEPGCDVVPDTQPSET